MSEFEENVNGKRVVASSPEELAEGVAAVKAEKPSSAPDINDPKDGNKIVSPDNLHTEAPFDQATANNVPVPEEEAEAEAPEPAPKPTSAKSQKVVK